MRTHSQVLTLTASKFSDEIVQKPIGEMTAKSNVISSSFYRNIPQKNKTLEKNIKTSINKSKYLNFGDSNHFAKESTSKLNNEMY